MNYLRGAVSAISAPYQYYKELAPINPSTLTGAIDVIVVRVTTPDGEVDLSCSPFHVRFGKWQVLRPGDKKVNVSVNGKLIPYNMKIGEAGEAFFVFETDADVPDDLITSPILEATRPGQKNVPAQVQAGKFGSKETAEYTSAQEPEYFDLDDTGPSANGSTSKDEDVTTPTEMRQGSTPPTDNYSSLSKVADAVRPSNFLDASMGLGKAVVHAVIETERENRERLQDRVSAARNVAGHMSEYASRRPTGTQQTGDEALPDVETKIPSPHVEYRGDVVIDLAGYHERGASERTITPDAKSTETPGTKDTPNDSDSDEPDTPHPAPVINIRATSEPPPDMEDDPFPTPTRSRATHSPTRRKRRTSLALALPPGVGPDADYMWEWGAFPQRSPRVDRFVRGSNQRGIRMSATPKSSIMPPADKFPSRVHWGRAKSEPVDSDLDPEVVRHEDAGEGALAANAALVRDHANPMRIGAHTAGRTLWFELSVLDPEQVMASESARKGVLLEMEPIIAADVFEQGAVSYDRLIHDDSVLREDGLVIRFADERYITRLDAAPIMDMLPVWRASTVRFNSPADPHSKTMSTLTENGGPVRFPEEPLSSGDEADRASNVTKPAPRTRKTSSWVRWWSRSTKEEDDIEKGADDPIADPRSTASSPRMPTMLLTADTLSPFPPQFRSNTSSDTLSRPSSPEPASDKKFIKTLRLTSDQLKVLDLKLGSNSITFSLSASGVIACTARIFVWESTDSIVISDIDGTITKSDALGHVFTMIGRDWTHLGVAKLYTDVTRNGYKIMYLTSRAIGQADSTREYLKGIKQNDYQLPEGPVIMSPDRLMASLHREVIMRKPEVFKMACLRDIRRLFGEGNNPFYAGFGNRITDALSYRSVDVPSSRIFTIDTSGDVKLELLELAGYKSSYIHMTDLVDQMFPPIHKRFVQEYTDTNFWKPPIGDFALPDFTPPSPALSARSDTSNQSALARLRSGFSLGGGKTSHRATPDLVPANLRKMERSTSPDIGEDERGEWRGVRRGGPRARSVDSMPGSLPGSEDDTVWEDDEEGEVDEEYVDNGEEQEPMLETDEAFDEDVLAAGEMASVPFL